MKVFPDLGDPAKQYTLVLTEPEFNALAAMVGF